MLYFQHGKEINHCPWTVFRQIGFAFAGHFNWKYYFLATLEGNISALHGKPEQCAQTYTNRDFSRNGTKKESL